ncbi:MAG: hypothetical protein NVSMB63_14860 [Sediminibacterium sp.]
MHSFFTLRKSFAFPFIFLVIVSGCTRITSTDIGTGLIPPIDGVNTKDTLLDVITNNFDDADTARIYRSDNHVLGAITKDPLFGTTTAAMFFELHPDSYPFNIPGAKDSIRIDSAVLILSYKGAYGDSAQPLTLTVSEISQSTPLNYTKNYPVNYPNAFPVTIGSALAPPLSIDIRRLTDSVNNRFENAKNQVRIRLRNDVAGRFIKSYDSANAYKSDSAFRTYFAGFALTVNASNPANALLKINLVDTNTKFALYYSSSAAGATKRDTSVSYFRFHTGRSGDANFVTRNRSGSEVASHFAVRSKSDSLIYLQTSPGTYVRLRIPGLQNLGNRIIHRAELITEQVPDDANAGLETQLTPPRNLLLSVYDSVNNSKRNIPNDYIFSNTGPNIATFGGNIVHKSVPGYDRIVSYVFDISRYVQGIVTRKDTAFTLRLSAPVNDSLRYTPPYPANMSNVLYYLSPAYGNDPADGRVRLGGGTHSRFRTRLRIIFSRI